MKFKISQKNYLIKFRSNNLSPIDRRMKVTSNGFKYLNEEGSDIAEIYSTPWSNEIIEIKALNAEPEYELNGLGTNLLARAIRQAKVNGYSLIILKDRAKSETLNRAVRNFYSKRGFVEGTGQFSDYKIIGVADER